jgi:hypothetical protein
MKSVRWILGALLVPAALAAQQPAAPSTSPTADGARRFHRFVSPNLIAAAEAVPDSLLNFKPTPAQLSFGRIWEHLAGANFSMCAGIGGTTAPVFAPRDTTKPYVKDSLVARLKASFAFCDTVLAKVDDTKLSEIVDMGFQKAPRATALFAYVYDITDHYSQVANYMRLKGLTPPSALPRPGRGRE